MMMKKMLFVLSVVFLGTAMNAVGKEAVQLSDQQILDIIEKNKPLKSGDVPAGLKNRLGATHVSGQYYFTDEPYIIEGAKKLQDLGYGNLKLWFNKSNGPAHGYKYNSDWNLKKTMTLEEMANHPYYSEVFDMPFSTIALNISYGYGKASTKNRDKNNAQVEQEFYDLATHFLKKYKDREVTFILSNWEGDWILRGGTSKHSRWNEDGVSLAAPIRIKNMIDWVTARQKGVSRAREDFGESKAKVFNAVEVNKVFDGILRGLPTITTDVLPHVEVDMVSWSAYDGKADKYNLMTDGGVRMYRGIDHIRNHMNPTPYMKGEKVVFIGEINEHENLPGMTREWLLEFCDIVMGVYLAQEIPYIYYWELYANEPSDGKKKSQDYQRTAEQTNGNWLIRPDGSHGWAQEYFDKLLIESAKADRATGLVKDDPATWTELFDGESLNGWQVMGGEGDFSVQNGEIVATSKKGSSTSFLTTEKVYADFILEYDAKVDYWEINSGMQFRSGVYGKEKRIRNLSEKLKVSDKEWAPGTVWGYQVELDSTKRAWSGALYEESGRGWMVPLIDKDKKAARKAYKKKKWNNFKVKAVGNHIQIWVNDVLTVNTTDDKRAVGFFGLELQSTKKDKHVGKKVHWKNIRVMEL